MRLTYELGHKGSGEYDTDNTKDMPVNNIWKAINKLGKLEDIEEQYGIDLIKAVELCKQVNNKKVVYIKDECGIDTLKILDGLDIELFSHRLYRSSRGMYVSLDLYEYGVTWALTKEELEK